MKNRLPFPDQLVRLPITITFTGNLRSLLPKGLSEQSVITHLLKRRASIKDVVESMGVPHPEIEAIIVNGAPVSFSYIVRDGDHVEVMPPTWPVDFSTPTLLRPCTLADVKFVVDTNVGKLARLLRMAGFDTAYENGLADKRLAEIAAAENRILLTRDRKLLNRKLIVYGHLVRENRPEKQLAEVIHYYGLAAKVRPFSRCLRCNSPLEPVAKKEIMARLKPLTRKYYSNFNRCPKCDRIYWPGSHREKMEKTLDKTKDYRPQSMRV